MKGMFFEDAAEHVHHTALSSMLVERPGAFDMLGNQLEEFCPAGIKVLDAMDEPGWSMDEPSHTGYNLYHKTDRTVYLELSQHPERFRRFGSAIEFLTSGPEYDMKHFIDGFDWEELDRREGDPATVIDVGGGKGQAVSAISKATKRIRFVVQDLPENIDQSQKHHDRGIQPQDTSRIKFMAHDFFKPQPIVGADVYLFRWIFHNWSDKYCLSILHNLVPALRTGCTLLLCEYVLPDRASTTWKMNR